MTLLLDIAALLALLLTLSLVPALGLRQEARITRELRAAAEREQRRAAAPGRRAVRDEAAHR